MDETPKQDTESPDSIEGPRIIKTVSRPTMLEELTTFVYVNGTEFSSNNWDVRLALGERLPNGASEARVGIVMSHQHFKAFVDAMTIQLGKLEEMMGEIRYTPIKFQDVAEVQSKD